MDDFNFIKLDLQGGKPIKLLKTKQDVLDFHVEILEKELDSFIQERKRQEAIKQKVELIESLSMQYPEIEKQMKKMYEEEKSIDEMFKILVKICKEEAQNS